MKAFTIVFFLQLLITSVVFAQLPGTSVAGSGGSSSSQCATDGGASTNIECLDASCSLAVRSTVPMMKVKAPPTPEQLCREFNDKHTDCPKGGPCSKACDYMKKDLDGCDEVLSSDEKSLNSKCELNCRLLFKDTGYIGDDRQICSLCCDVSCGEGPHFGL